MLYPYQGSNWTNLLQIKISDQLIYCGGYQKLVLQLTYSANWDDSKDEISSRYVVQRDSLVFAKKLDRNLTGFAAELKNEVQRFV